MPAATYVTGRTKSFHFSFGHGPSRADNATMMPASAPAHQVATTCHLANISLRVGRKITWDAQKEQIVGDPQANEMLTRPYRSPWDKELQSLQVV